MESCRCLPFQHRHISPGVVLRTDTPVRFQVDVPILGQKAVDAGENAEVITPTSETVASIESET